MKFVSFQIIYLYPFTLSHRRKFFFFEEKKEAIYVVMCLFYPEQISVTVRNKNITVKTRRAESWHNIVDHRRRYAQFVKMK